MPYRVSAIPLLSALASDLQGAFLLPVNRSRVYKPKSKCVQNVFSSKGVRLDLRSLRTLRTLRTETQHYETCLKQFDQIPDLPGQIRPRITLNQ